MEDSDTQHSERHVLDCTLRCFTEGEFRPDLSRKIIQSVVDSGVQIIEVGLLTETSGRKGYASVHEADEMLSRIRLLDSRPNPIFVAMMHLGDFQVQRLPECRMTSHKIYGIRLTFKKEHWKEAAQQASIIIEKGYKLFVQPVLTAGYKDLEILEMLGAFGRLDFYAMYIDDSFGSMTGEQLRRYFSLFENNLDKRVRLGFHGQNNMQLAYSHSITFFDLAHQRNIIIDASVLGMGRGAGGINSELLLDFMNKRFASHYSVQPLLEVIDSNLEAIKRENPGGYSIAQFLSARLNMHPAYATYLTRKNNLTVRDMDRILRKIAFEHRVEFREEVIEALYLQSRDEFHMKENIDVSLFQGTNFCILASGPSARIHQTRILSYAKHSEAKIIALNYIPDFLDHDYIFMNNQKRYDEFADKIDKNKLIATTNLLLKYSHRGCQLVDFSALVKETKPIYSDNCAVLFLALAYRVGVQSVGFAGLDGFCPSYENYNYVEPAGTWDEEEMERCNNELANAVSKFGRDLKLAFITPSRFEKNLPVRACGVIPARFMSSRFEGKPLIPIAGVPMIKRTYDQVAKSKSLDHLVVATDDDRIAKFCEEENIPFMMTSSDCLTGTDRVAEVAQRTDYNYYINIQGDEPIIDPKTIDQVIDAYRKNRNNYIAYNLYKRMNAADAHSETVVKVIVNEQDELMYMSRFAVPFEKGDNDRGYLKQVPVYGFTKRSLELFASTGKSPVEKSEDVEILRFVEKGHKVLMIETEFDSIAVDVPSDVAVVESWLSGKE